MTDKDKSSSDKPADKKPDEAGAVARANAAAEAAGLSSDDVSAAFDASGAAPAHPIEDLQARVARLEHVLFTALNEHFGGKIPALAAPAELPGEKAEA